jgi:hypothetical protein
MGNRQHNLHTLGLKNHKISAFSTDVENLCDQKHNTDFKKILFLLAEYCWNVELLTSSRSPMLVIRSYSRKNVDQPQSCALTPSIILIQ